MKLSDEGGLVRGPASAAGSSSGCALPDRGVPVLPHPGSLTGGAGPQVSFGGTLTHATGERVPVGRVAPLPLGLVVAVRARKGSYRAGIVVRGALSDLSSRVDALLGASGRPN